MSIIVTSSVVASSASWTASLTRAVSGAGSASHRSARWSEPSTRVIGWRTSWSVVARNDSRSVSIRSESEVRPTVAAPSSASPTRVIPATASLVSIRASSCAAIARPISWRRIRNSVTTATGPRPWSNRAWACAIAAAATASSSSGAADLLVRQVPSSAQDVDDRVEQRGDVVGDRLVRPLARGTAGGWPRSASARGCGSAGATRASATGPRSAVPDDDVDPAVDVRGGSVASQPGRRLVAERSRAATSRRGYPGREKPPSSGGFVALERGDD